MKLNLKTVIFSLLLFTTLATTYWTIRKHQSELTQLTIPITLTIVAKVETAPSPEFGDGSDFEGFDEGSGNDSDFGGGFGSIPLNIKKCCSKEARLQRLK